jgi:hypothetical protein
VATVAQVAFHKPHLYPRHPVRRAITFETNDRREHRHPVRVCGHHHHRHRFRLRGVIWKSSGQSSLREPGIAIQLVELARYDVQKSKGGSKDDGGEDEDSVARLTAGDVWLFPVVG